MSDDDLRGVVREMGGGSLVLGQPSFVGLMSYLLDFGSADQTKPFKDYVTDRVRS